MGITNANKELSKSKIECNGLFNVKLSLNAVPNIQSTPTDIVLVLDNSSSMNGIPLTNLKIGAKEFIRVIDEATDGGENGNIGDGSRIGIVSFNSTAIKLVQLSTQTAPMYSNITAMQATGLTNHSEAFQKAIELFDDASTNRKVIVMFTDGKTTVGPDANIQASLAKSKGIVIYCLGLDTGALDVPAMRLWSSQPSSAYVSIAPKPSDIEKIFANLVTNLSTVGATNIKVRDTISPCFKVVRVLTPSKGTASVIDNNNVEWNIDELGVSGGETATFEFEVEHIGPCKGLVDVNESIEYSDTEGNIASFPSPQINVECEPAVVREDCPEPANVIMNSCEDYLLYEAGNLNLEGLGRILEVNTIIKNVCPNRKVALAAYLTEVDSQGIETSRGIKIMEIPAHTEIGCQDIMVKCIKFALPEPASEADPDASLCKERRFKVRFIAHYIDTNVNFDCCNAT